MYVAGFIGADVTTLGIGVGLCVTIFIVMLGPMWGICLWLEPSFYVLPPSVAVVS